MAEKNNTGLPDNLKSGVEGLSGHSHSDVKVHYNSSKPARLNALAFTGGTHIHVAPGQEAHLPHEAWHVQLAPADVPVRPDYPPHPVPEKQRHAGPAHPGGPAPFKPR